METDIFSLITRRADEYTDQITTYLTAGNVSDMEQYKLLVGKLEGIQLLLGDIKDIEQRYIET